MNNFEGDLPTTLTSLTKLQYLESFDTYFTGSVPVIPSVRLQGVDFSNNKLTGDFPFEYFNQFNFPKFWFLNINFNYIPLPA